MIEILVYLFETYGYADACPKEPDQLARKLSAEGFDEADISSALEWLSGLRRTAQASQPVQVDTRSVRVFSERENARLDVASRGFVMFLCASGVLDAVRRECVIERALALPSPEVSLSEMKVAVLMVLWQDRVEVDGLVLHELMIEEVEGDDSAGDILVH